MSLLFQIRCVSFFFAFFLDLCLTGMGLLANYCRMLVLNHMREVVSGNVLITPFLTIDKSLFLLFKDLKRFDFNLRLATMSISM